MERRPAVSSVQTRAARLASLIAGKSVRVGTSALGEEGLFATKAIAASTVVIDDVPLAWLPEWQQTDDDGAASDHYCRQCGACLATPAALLAALDGGTPLALPALGEFRRESILCCEHCPRKRDKAVAAQAEEAKGGVASELAGWEQVRLATQLAGCMVREHAASRDDGWRHILDALASPTWAEVVEASRRPGDDAADDDDDDDDDDDPQLAEKSQAFAMAALKAAKLPAASVDRVLGGAAGLVVWSRALGAIARNAIWAQVPSPLVFYLSAFEEAMQRRDAAAVAVYAPLIGTIQRLLKAQEEEEERKQERRRRMRKEGAGEKHERGESGEGDHGSVERPRKRLRGGLSDDGGTSGESDEGDDDGGSDEEDGEDGEDGDDDDDDDESSSSSEASDGEEEMRFSWKHPDAPDNVTFSSSLFPAHKGTALYPLISKANHSCEPNCFLLWQTDACAKLISLEPIKKGAELTIDYLGERANEYSVARRRRWLLEQYGFLCKCAACSRSGAPDASQPTVRRTAHAQEPLGCPHTSTDQAPPTRTQE